MNIKKRLAHDTRLPDINAVDSHKRIGDGLAAVGEQGVGVTGGDDFHGHPGVDADAVHLAHPLGCDAKSRHTINIYMLMNSLSAAYLPGAAQYKKGGEIQLLSDTSSEAPAKRPIQEYH